MSFSTVASCVEGGDRVCRLYGTGDSEGSASTATVPLDSQKERFASQRSSGKTR